MAQDIFKFWAQLRPGQKIHPADKEAFKRINSKRHGFQLECLPGNFGGCLRTAPVVLLYLSPGFSEFDLADAKDPAGRRYHFQKLKGRAPFSDDPKRPGNVWLKSRTRLFGGWQMVRKRLAVVNIGAYHSRAFSDYSILAALPSSRVALDWAQEKLFREAEAGKRIVICMRSASYWGLEVGRRYSGTLFAPHVTRSGHLNKNSENAQLIELVKRKIEAV
jgi:hypothetical protein